MFRLFYGHFGHLLFVAVSTFVNNNNIVRFAGLRDALLVGRLRQHDYRKSVMNF